ncbi:kinetochore Sim4 complex subunit FTA2-domain-containing protein [Nemania sp. FL0031]|nr:kinetochore Sim4 complex subunit FTA2-domain-containing protein [Nemania sp. FL0031]
MSDIVKANRKLLAADKLPPCKGPKLRAFENSGAPITFIELLERSEPSGFQAYVFKVSIKSRIYALKVFKFFKPADGKRYLTTERQRIVKDELAAFHCDPFYAECRAYGRIEELKEQGIITRKLAAECYGFLALKPQEEEEINRMGISLWDLPEDDDYRRRAEGSPVRAIVKEFVGGTSSLRLRTCKHMLKSLRLLNEYGLIVRDIKADNYKAGLLIDFGSAWTIPHCILEWAPKHVANAWGGVDPVRFDEMLQDHNMSFRLRALPNMKYQMKLRSWKLRG